MNIYVDCEFNGFGGELMSLALVTDDGVEWYECLPLPDNIHPWVLDNVVPIMGKSPIDKSGFIHSLRSFLMRYENPTICADWYTDIVHFFQCFQGRDHTESFNYPCKAELRLIEEYKSETPHNALSDARAIREAWHKGDE